MVGVVLSENSKVSTPDKFQAAVSQAPRARTKINQDHGEKLARRLGTADSADESSLPAHKLTFTVNGKQLALEPPPPPPPSQEQKANLSATSQSSDLISADRLARGKVSRLGEFVSPVDYDSGFDFNSEADSNSVGSSSSQLGGLVKLDNVRDAQSDASRPSLGSSSLSALMSPGGQGVADDNVNNGAESQTANNMSTSRSPGLRNHTRMDSGEPSKIISDWPKASANSRQSSSFLYSPDRNHSKATSLRPSAYRAPLSQAKNQASSARFSSLLSGSALASTVGGFNGSNDDRNAGSSSGNNEAYSQSADQLSWDAKQLRKSPAPQSKFATKAGNTEILTGPLTGADAEVPALAAKTSVKRNVYPKAPVAARARYNPSMLAPNSFFNSDSTPDQLKTSFDLNKGGAEPNDGSDDKQSQSASDSAAPNEVASFHVAGQPIRLGAAKTSSSSAKLTAANKADQSPLSITEVNHNGDQRSETHVGTQTEYRTNFTDYTPTPKHSSSTRRQKPSTSGDTSTASKGDLSHAWRARLSARDLTNKLELPLLPAGLNRASFHQQQQQQQDVASLKFSSPLVPLGSTLNNSSASMSPAQLIYSSQQPTTTAKAAQHADQLGSSERLGSIVRSGSIMPNPTGADTSSNHHNYAGFLPATMALLAHAHDDYRLRSSTGHKLRSLLASQQVGPDTGKSLGLLPTRADHMMATANQLGVTHMGPQSMSGPGGASAALNDVGNNGYANDYSDARQLAGAGSESSSSSMDSGLQSPLPASSRVASLSDDQRGPQSEHHYSNDLSNGYDPPGPAVRGSKEPESAGGDHLSNSRSSMSDVFIRPNPKTREASNLHPLRSSLDPFEDMPGGVVPSDYERELADLDEEFSRHAGYSRRPSPGSLMSDSFLSLSPEKYEARRYARRPYGVDFPGEYLATAGSMSSMVPRAYSRTMPWASGSHYGDTAADLWADSSADFSPLGSYMSPHYSQYRYRPRYQRISPYGSYLSASASEHHLQPAYNIVPAAGYAAPVPTETISFALSPLAAAAAAAASAIVAADKSRHQPGHGWLTLPRFSVASSTSGATSGAQQASSPTPSASLAGQAALQTAAYIHRAPTPGTYALNSIPIYAIGPRPGGPAPLATAASGANPAILPYFHTGAPAIIAYRPASVVPSTSLLTAASFAYPLRLPAATSIGRPTPIAIGGSARSIGLRPAMYADLQLSESKSKSNLTHNMENGGTNSNNKGSKSVSLSAMARNLTRKMFGSASQMRPLHIAPPSLDLFGSSSQQNSSSTNSTGANSGNPPDQLA